MTTDEQNEKQEKSPPARKAKTGAWWKSVAKEKKGQPGLPQGVAPVVADGDGDAIEQEPVLPAAASPNEPQLSRASAADVVETSTTEAGSTASGEALAPMPAQERAKAPEPWPGDVTVPADKGVAADAGPAEQAADTETQAEADQTDQAEEAAPAKKRRSRRGGRRRSKQAAAEVASPEEEATPATGETPAVEEAEPVAPADAAAESTEEDDDHVEDVESDVPEKPVTCKLLINAEEPEECRIALVEDGRLESFHVTTVDREPTKNNIYKGRVVSVEANLQAAFVDIGTGRNGFLPFNEIHPEYYRQDVNERVRTVIAQQQWKKLKIEEVIQKGQEVLVQVVKEVTGNKGANMTTYLSLPGRCLVLMPGSDSAGISRKIVGEERRAGLREIMSEFEIPEGIGYIIRTASAEITKAVLEKDLQNLLVLWEEVKHRGQTMEAPALVYEEQDTVVRFLRDHFFPEIKEITVDTEESLNQVNTFIGQLPEKQRQVKVKLHRGTKPIFNQFNIEEQIESVFKPQVILPSGGSIVINPTEALVAIDVNSGRTSKNADFDETIFLANMEAASELARQLRLRDLGGLIVVDFIDMRNKKHIREVERQVKISMKRDKAKVDISKISRFGLMQISRQKMGAPIEKGSYRTCDHCQGRGVVRSVETLALYYLRRIQTGISRKKVARIECRLPLDVAQYLLNKKRTELAELESRHSARIDIIPRVEMRPADNQIDFFETDTSGR
ncbi:MAG: Rne/Rng family ribonuclease [Desulfobulbus sp.]|jgi:ribonuclease E|uniref:Rne/Rng family ribonuclease n=1 Tax=Desulfobulbus sp. TaxID=895 RepID=UPI00283AD961|nr:Rne/Rng family ribonuclease [Desulfobulbus sp.]MDR2549728.1 Rne/Rng family ribonuclease [Desulfobulbus sp.]